LSGLALLGLWLVLPLNAQERQPADAVKHSLWKVEGPHSTIYLLGSVHLLKKENYPLAASMEAAFSNAQIAVFELDQDKMHEPGAHLRMMSKARLPTGETLQEHLSPETYAAFAKHARKAGLSPEIFETFKPFMAVTVLEMAELEKLGFEPRYGLDEYFFGRVHKEGKEVLPLETVDFQIDLFTGFLKEESESIVKAELKEIDNVTQGFADIVKAWETGDAEKLEKLLNEAMQESPVMFKRLVTDRNKTWVPKLEELARGATNAIVIVGAGHLVGKDGIVELLKKKGLKVTQQ
jgi:uncharacterized protein YbaP (TraB family)